LTCSLFPPYRGEQEQEQVGEQVAVLGGAMRKSPAKNPGTGRSPAKVAD
jgi:hypothetical protein